MSLEAKARPFDKNKKNDSATLLLVPGSDSTGGSGSTGGSSTGAPRRPAPPPPAPRVPRAPRPRVAAWRTPAPVRLCPWRARLPRSLPPVLARSCWSAAARPGADDRTIPTRHDTTRPAERRRRPGIVVARGRVGRAASRSCRCSAGVSRPSVLRGRPFGSTATASRVTDRGDQRSALPAGTTHSVGWPVRDAIMLKSPS